MKKYIGILSAALALCLGGASCTSILDDEEQLGALGSQKFYANATDDQAVALISSVYTSAWRTRGSMDDYTDDRASSTAYEDVNQDGFSGDLSLTTLYQINYKCNLIIENLASDTAEKRRVIAEAYFFRGWAFYQLTRAWGTPPLVDHVLASDELTPVNGTAPELWAYVQDSFDKAVEGLPSKSGLGGQHALGARVTRETALAFKGKAYLYAGDKASAAAALKQVIDSGKYKLLDDFSDLYTVKGDWSDEYLWEFNAKDDNDDKRATEAKITYSNNWRGENVMMPGGDHLAGFPEGHSNSWPSANFYRFLAERGEVGKNRQKGTVWTPEEAAGMFITLSGDEYKGSPNYEGDYLAAKMAEGYTEDQAAFRLLWKDFVNPNVTNCEGYFGAKVYMWHSDMYTAMGNTDVFSKANYPVMRYSDVLLLYAEATLDTQAGLSALNTVRNRAGLPSLAKYTLKDIQDERRAEFFGEGERWFDCVRWGIAKEVFTAAKVGATTSTTIANRDYTVSVSTTDQPNYRGWDDKYLLFPYPTSELSQNPNLKQNPGW